MSFSTTEPITASDLQALLTGPEALILLDVLPPESFEAERIPGAVNACVYQTDFLDVARPLIPNPDQLVVVYDLNTDSLASAMAADRLTSAGYRRVLDFRGGLAEWRQAGFAIEGLTDEDQAPTPLTRTLTVDPGQSLLEWTGRNIANRHHGTIDVLGGRIELRDGEPTTGEIQLDLTTIKSTDLTDPKLERALAGHLMSPDFLDSEQFPASTFTLTAIRPVESCSPGEPNHFVSGTLTLKGITQPVDFLAAIGATATGDLVAQATLQIDRTKWNVLYGSGKFFARLGQHLVSDLVSIHLKITAR